MFMTARDNLPKLLLQYLGRILGVGFLVLFIRILPGFVQDPGWESLSFAVFLASLSAFGLLAHAPIHQIIVFAKDCKLPIPDGFVSDCKRFIEDQRAPAYNWRRRIHRLIRVVATTAVIIVALSELLVSYDRANRLAIFLLRDSIEELVENMQFQVPAQVDRDRVRRIVDLSQIRSQDFPSHFLGELASRCGVRKKSKDGSTYLKQTIAIVVGLDSLFNTVQYLQAEKIDSDRADSLRTVSYAKLCDSVSIAVSGDDDQKSGDTADDRRLLQLLSARMLWSLTRELSDPNWTPIYLAMLANISGSGPARSAELNLRGMTALCRVTETNIGTPYGSSRLDSSIVYFRAAVTCARGPGSIARIMNNIADAYLQAVLVTRSVKSGAVDSVSSYTSPMSVSMQARSSPAEVLCLSYSALAEAVSVERSTGVFYVTRAQVLSQLARVMGGEPQSSLSGMGRDIMQAVGIVHARTNKDVREYCCEAAVNDLRSAAELRFPVSEKVWSNKNLRRALGFEIFDTPKYAKWKDQIDDSLK